MHKYKILTTEELWTKPPLIEWLDTDVIEKGAIHMIHGESGSGKTFITLKLALDIAECNRVLWLGGEGINGLKRRIAAYMESIPNDRDFYLFPHSISLNEDADAKLLRAQIKNTCHNPELIVIDTLHNFFSGDENSSQDVAKMIKRVKQIQEENSGCAIVIIHHTGVSKSANQRARGSSSWKGAVDYEYSVMKGNIKTLTQIKNRDGELIQPKSYQLKVVEIKKWGQSSAIAEEVQGFVVAIKPGDDNLIEILENHLEFMRLSGGCDDGILRKKDIATVLQSKNIGRTRAYNSMKENGRIHLYFVSNGCQLLGDKRSEYYDVSSIL